MANRKYRPANAPTAIPEGCCTIAVSATPPSVQRTHNAIPMLLTRICDRPGFMSSPCFGRLVLPLAQQVAHLGQREAGRAGPRDELAHHLVELPAPLHVVPLHFLVADERAGALLRLEHLANFHFAIRACHGIGID